MQESLEVGSVAEVRRCFPVEYENVACCGGRDVVVGSREMNESEGREGQWLITDQNRT